MTADEDLHIARAGDQALLVGRDRKLFVVRLEPGAKLHTHRGMLPHDQLIGSAWGQQCPTHLGYSFLLLRPSLDDLVRDLKRTTQIIYPKDAGYILLKMSIISGCRVIEAGTGSGALTIMLAHAVGPTGRVYSYEIRPDIQGLARKNLESLGLEHRVDLRLGDIRDGFADRGADALFLDLPNPWDYLPQARAALANGGFFGCILPTTNQVSDTIAALEMRGFGMIEMEELLLRPYKAVPARLRPMDRMVAHTGYLLFARALITEELGHNSDHGQTT
ncbi:MAG: tRNA (adenine-N1)-methyltransferase [Anaerolineales bacterium]|nr:tRNA (adenine-N1)-methyltransferase [Anaerolineales bacterium]